MKAKHMKILIITILMSFTVQSYAVEFHQCIDKIGQQHFTNLPALSLDSNCKEKTDRYSYLINQDYSNLEQRYKEYLIPDVTDQQDDDSLNLKPTDKPLDQVNDSVLPIDSVMKPILDVIDPGNVLEEVNNRKSQLESVISEEKTGTLADGT